MHELGIANAMLKMVDRIMQDEHLTAVYQITVEIGELSGVVPHFLSDCWEAVRDGTRYQDTALEIKTVPGRLRCEDCKAEFAVDLNDLRCPDCGGFKLTPLAGRDMTIRQIEGD